MKKIIKYFKPYKIQSICGPLFKLCEATFELLVPFIIALIIDKGLGAPNSEGVYENFNKAYIIKMSIVLIALGLIGFLCAVTAQYFAAKAATGVAANVRSSLFSKLQSLSYSQLDQLGTSTMLTRTVNDVDKLQVAINMALRLFLRSPFIVFGAMVMAFIINKRIAVIFLITILVLSLIVVLIMAISMPMYKKSQNELDEVTLSVRENLTGVRVLRAFCREEDEKKVFNERNASLTKERKIAGAVSALLNPLTYIVINLGIIALIYSGALKVDSGVLTQGKVVALYNLMAQILIELIKFANLIVTVSKGIACGKRIEEILALDNNMQRLEEMKEVKEAPYISYENVSASYNGGGKALSNVNFTIEKGSIIGIIGGTGSGKTTLINLLPHFYDVDNGSIKIQGVDVKSIKDDVLLKKIGIVPQKSVLFSGTIRDNLLYGNKDASDEELLKAVKIAQAEDVVNSKGGLDGIVSQGAKNFSGGQKQRLTIARAIVKRPEILILDDSSSALDYSTEYALRKELCNLDFKPTIIIVSQRTSSVMDADKIIVLDEGKVVGIGTNEELIRNCSVYNEIYCSQNKKVEGDL